MKQPMFLESAREMIRTHGYVEAKRICIQARDMNSAGTASYAFHNAVLKQINLAATCGRIEGES